jgi:hypothetical protein
MNTPRPSKVFYLYLIVASKDSKWRHLESVEEPIQEEDDEIYVNCLLQYGHCLTRLFVTDCIRKYSAFGTAQYNRLTNSLGQFTQLTYLKLTAHCNSNCLLDSLDHAIDKCPTLISLSFKLILNREAVNAPDINIGRNLNQKFDLPRPGIKYVEEFQI